MTNVRCLSLNSNGLNIPKKRTAVLRELWRMRTQVAFIQETRFQSGKVPKFKEERYTLVFHSTAQTLKRGGRVSCFQGWSHGSTSIR